MISSTAVFSQSAETRHICRACFSTMNFGRLVCCTGNRELLFSFTIDSDTDILIFDCCSIPLDGALMVGRILSFNPELHIIVVCSHAQMRRERHLWERIHIDLHVTDLVNTAQVRHLFEKIRARTLIARFELTEREQEVLQLISLGYTTREIGAELQLCTSTVQVFRKKLSRKLGTNRVAVQTQLALQMQLIDLCRCSPVRILPDHWP